MCGIAGIVNFQGDVDQRQMRLMTAALAHRGPDGEGIWSQGNVAIGHRRLAIIDLEAGQQPLCNEDGTVWVTFNGEIYNYRELRRQLLQQGHRFKTQSDTEVIVHAYEEWGDRCVEKFRGMFAFGIVDLRQRRVFLARDHLGIKPLYYLYTPSCFAFASELQALRCLSDTPLALDLESIDQYLWLQYIPAPRTAFKQVYKLQPAHRISIGLAGQLSDQEEYWQVRFQPNYGRTSKEWLEELEATLKDSVQAHLVADVPFGAFLSGGVDSSVIVAYMAQILDRPVKTFSIGFEEADFNELDYAQTASDRWGTEHYVEIVKPDALAILPELVKHYGEPFGDSSAIPTYYVCQLARQHVTMVLSGDGGDEAFAGYHTYRSWLSWLSRDEQPAWKRFLYPLASRLRNRKYPARQESLEGWLKHIQQTQPDQRIGLWRKDYQQLVHFSQEKFEWEFARTSTYGRTQKVQYLDLKTYLPFSVLTKVDTASMIHSLEVRTPLTDVAVIEFAATIPESLNIAKNQQGEWEGKLLLKQLMEKYYPAEFLHRPKMGFSVPLQRWFAPGGSLREAVQERLLSPRSHLHEYFRPHAIEQLLHENATTALWLLLFLEEWLTQQETPLVKV